MPMGASVLVSWRPRSVHLGAQRPLRPMCFRWPSGCIQSWAAFRRSAIWLGRTTAPGRERPLVHERRRVQQSPAPTAIRMW